MPKNPFANAAIGTAEVLVILAIGVVVCIPLVLLFLWLGSRGQMMAIRSVAVANADIGEAWNATRHAGGALFRFHLVMTVIVLGVLAPTGGTAAYLAIADDGQSIMNGGAALFLVLALGAIAGAALFTFLLVDAMARNFVAPIMLKENISARAGWLRFWAVGRNHVGSIILFYILRVLVGIAAGIVGMLASFATCCLGFLPVLHQTLMAPYYVFERAWTLEVLASMSPDFDLRSGGPPPPPQAPFYPPPAGPNPYAPSPDINPYAPPGYGGGGYGGPQGGS